MRPAVRLASVAYSGGKIQVLLLVFRQQWLSVPGLTGCAVLVWKAGSFCLSARTASVTGLGLG